MTLVETLETLVTVTKEYYSQSFQVLCRLVGFFSSYVGDAKPSSGPPKIRFKYMAKRTPP